MSSKPRSKYRRTIISHHPFKPHFLQTPWQPLSCFPAQTDITTLIHKEHQLSGKLLGGLCSAWPEMKSTFTHSHVFANTWNISKMPSLYQRGTVPWVSFSTALSHTDLLKEPEIIPGAMVCGSDVAKLLASEDSIQQWKDKMDSYRNWDLQPRDMCG